ncbi:MAG: 2-succinyl-5-enolpyruvyl-6-hydroxy-3-cyclohexene-1-carboxylic-acid synthase [Flavobacteriaceae bacterium]
MHYPKILLAQNLIEIFRQKGIENIVISPGSRNAPLTIGFTSNPEFTCYSIVDERCAGFFALGIAQQIRKPVAVVCTSGSALLNYYPALAEAFYSQIPFVVVSADRPVNKIDIGDGQTIRQQNVFSNHILYNANLTEEASEENNRKIYEALDISVLKKGPVHINVPFEEPLYETTKATSFLKIPSQTNDINTVTYSSDLSSLLKDSYHSYKKKLILVGTNYPDEIDSDIIEKLANDPSVVVMTETTSNIFHEKFVNKIDVLITPFSEEDFKTFQPDLLITFGGMIISKRIKAFLRKYKPQQHWHIDPLRAYDTFGCLSQHIEEQPNDFFKKLLSEATQTQSNYNDFVQKIKAEREGKTLAFIRTAPYSDFTIFDKIIKTLPDAIQLQVSNSTAIRYLQLFDLKPSIEVFCNRGTSGIDGSTSTAIGASVISEKPIILITGDIGFFYDSNALWNSYIPNNFKIILVNNSGGGIFRILPGHQKTEVFSTFFETQHNLNAEYLAKMFDFNYFYAQNELEVQIGLERFLKCDKKCILEIATPTEINNQVLNEFLKLQLLFP